MTDLQSVYVCVRSAGHKVVVEEALALGQLAHDQVLVLFRQLLLHLALQAPQQERAQNLGETRA